MKITGFILLVGCLQASALGYGQSVSITEKNAPLEKVLKEIKKQTGYDFLFESNLSRLAVKVDIQATNAPMKDVLEACFRNQPLTYTILDNIIIVRKKDGPAAPLALRAEVHGQVVDENGQPLSGATIAVEGSTMGVTTDAQGNFTLHVPDHAVLVISHIGYRTLKVTVGSRRELNISLQRADAGLTDVVITAFGRSEAKRNLSYAVSTVNNAQITNAGTDNIGTALIGKLPGADLVSTAGGPMAGNRINLRGINSLDVSSRPLIVVDGIPIFDNDDNFSSRGFGGNETGSGINDINPDDIESVTVLKGANAAALYGSQAMNGALIIQTKTGKGGKGLGVDYSSAYTLNQNYYFPKFQDQFGAGNSADAFDPPYSHGVQGYDSIPFYSPAISGVSFGPRFQGQPVLYWDGKVRPWTAQPDNYKDLFNDGHTLMNTIGFSGSTDRSSFRLSATNYAYTGFLPNMQETRTSVLLNVSQKVSKYITAEVMANYIYNYRQNPPERIDRANESLTTSDITSVLKANTFNASGYYLSDSAQKYLNGSSVAANIMQPLIWDPTRNRWQDNRGTLLGVATVTIQPIRQLSIRLRGGTDRLFDVQENKQAFMSYVAPTNLSAGAGYYGKAMTTNYKNHGDVLVTYDGHLRKDLSLTAFAGYSMDDEYDEYNQVYSGNGLMYNNIYSASNFKSYAITYNGTQIGTRTGTQGSATQGGERLNALFASATLGYKGWLYLTATDRNDWSSYLPSYSDHYNYPSIGSSFIFSDLFNLPAFVTFGKLRASYGVTGVPGSRYFANATYSQGSTYNNAILSSFSNTVPPSNLIAELNRSYEFGLEGGLWQNRLRLDLTYYINTSNNMINSVPIAPSTGATNMNVNDGSLRNKGIELQLTGDIIRTPKILWEMTLNGTHIDRKVLSLAPGLTMRSLGGSFNATQVAVPGGTPYDMYMLPLKRDTKTGEVLVDQYGIPEFDGTTVRSGNPLPKFYGGYINSFSYDHFTLTALIEYRFGGQVISYDNEFWTGLGLSKASLSGRDQATGGVTYTSGGTTYHDGIIFKGISAATGQPNTTVAQASTYYESRYATFGTQDAIYKNDYLRLREVSLAYAFPNAITRRLGVQRLSLSLIARNLWFLYKTVPNEAPDESLGTSTVNMGVLYSALPQTRDFGASLKVNF